jgi:thiol-disulfide isomerase/thioredoxin
MKKLVFMIGLMAIACGPSKLETNNKTDTGPSIDAQPLDPVGVIPADDCQQIDLGDKACNFRLTDQNGKTWDLYQHAGDIIVLDFSADWCYPCQLAADHTQPLQDEFADDGVQVVTVLLDGATPGVEPTEQELTRWVNIHGITTAPVLQGSRVKMLDSQDGTVSEPGLTGYLLNAFPTYIYIGRDMKFYAGHVGFSEEYMREKIQEGL